MTRIRRIGFGMVTTVAAVLLVAACTQPSGGGGSTPPPVNQNPIAAFTISPPTGLAVLNATLDGSFSADPDGTIASYSWDLGDGDTADTPTVAHSYPAGTYTIVLTVTDNDGAIDTDTRVLTVNPAPPVAAFSAIPASGPAPLAVAFNAAGSSDSDGTIVSYQWNFGDGGTAVGLTTNHTFAVGTYTVTLTVTDDDGETDTATQVVGATNDAPVASFTTTPSSGNRPLNVNLNAAGSFDADGTIVSYSWSFPGGSAGGVNTSVVLTNLGTNIISLTVTDNNGATNTTTRTVTVNNAVPTASFTATPSSGGAPLNVSFNASASGDVDGTISSYSWDFDTAGTFPGDLATGVTTSHVYTPGVYTARLTVTDNNGATATTTRTITVTGSPAAPTGLQKTGSGCCDTYGDFSWNLVPGADAYYIQIDGYFLGGCVTDHGATINGQVSSGRVQAVGLCLGSNYDARIQTHANGAWGPFSGNINFNL